MLKRVAILILLFMSTAASAQLRLTLQDAIARTLKKNFDISIATLTEQQAARNNTLGNAGFSPTVYLNATVTESRNNVLSQLTSGGEQKNPSAVNSNINPYLLVNWTIFDGGRMFLVKKQLGVVEAQSGAALKAQMQSMVSRTIQVYAQVVWQKKQLVAVDTSLMLARVRMDISYLKYETGAGAKIDYLQARVDYNARQSDSLTAIGNLHAAEDSLKVLMGENEAYDYKLDDSLALNLDHQPLDKGSLADVNVLLGVYRYNAEISHLNEHIACAAFLPTLAFTGGYNYSRSENSVGFASFTRSYGPNGALTLSVPLFAGGNLRRQANVASLQAMKDDLLYERWNTILGRQYRTAWRNYQLSVAAYRLERDNIKYAKENLDVQQARFRVGVATTLESRQAETDYVTALVRLHTAAYNLKVNETIVLELENKLVK